jgi:outer membrane immunogenic protein
MKFFAIAAAALLSTTVAQAADLAVKAPVAAAPVAPMWQGFYIGAMGGYASETGGGQKGPLAGGTIGLQGQWGNIVAGLEADAAWADVKDSATLLGAVSATSRIRDTGTVRGRLGVAFDQVLLYGTAGYAWAQNRVDINIAVPPFTLGLSDTQFHSGWTAGGGVEVMFAPRWSVKAEYLYRSFSGKTYFAATIPGGIPTGTLQVHSAQVGVNFHF